MRPVNLIPPEERRGDHAPLRAGSLSYVIVGAFAAALVAVVALVLTQNSITDHENEIGQLEVAYDAASQRAQALAPYAEFASLQQERELTIATLAESRFDWERVLRELALVIPADISLVNLDAKTSGEGDEAGGSADTLGSSPNMAIEGCAPDHDAVAEFVAALQDIDGVTRVGLENSSKADAEAGSTSDTTAGCAGPDKSTSFALIAAFDGVVVPSEAATEPAPAPAAAPASAETANSPQEQVDEAGEATNLIPGAAR